MQTAKTVILNIDGEDVEFVRKDLVESFVDDFHEDESTNKDKLGELEKLNDVFDYGITHDMAEQLINVIINLNGLSQWFSAVDQDVDFLVRHSGLTRETVEKVVEHMRNVREALENFNALVNEEE